MTTGHPPPGLESDSPYVTPVRRPGPGTSLYPRDRTRPSLGSRGSTSSMIGSSPVTACRCARYRASRSAVSRPVTSDAPCPPPTPTPGHRPPRTRTRRPSRGRQRRQPADLCGTRPVDVAVKLLPSDTAAAPPETLRRGRSILPKVSGSHGNDRTLLSKIIHRQQSLLHPPCSCPAQHFH